MKEPKEDDERLSALLEGRVEGRQREELLAHLSAADDDYEVFTDTAAVLRALEEEDARRVVSPPSMRRGGWRLQTALAVTGTLVLLLAVGLVFRGRGTSEAADPLQLAMRADPNSSGLPEEWTIPPSSGAVRGEGPSADRDARAVQAGAMLVELAVAVRARDAVRTQVLAAQLGDIVDRGAGPGRPLGQIAAKPGAPADSLNALVAQATDLLKRQLAPEPLELGAWLEAARLAADARHTEFFQDGVSHGMLGRAKRLARDNRAARLAVASIHTALRVDSAPQWGVLRKELDALLSELLP